MGRNRRSRGSHSSRALATGHSEADHRRARVMLAKVLAVQVAQKTVEILQTQVPDEVVNVLVVAEHHVPMFIDDVVQEAEKYRGEEVYKMKIDAKSR